MSNNRRENIKKTLGISEYPWSSDDDDSETSPIVKVVRNPQTCSDIYVDRPSIADAPGHSGTQNSNGRVRGLWGQRLPVPVRAIDYPSRSSREDVPIPLSSRPSSSSERKVAQDLQRVLAFRRLSRQPSTYRPARTSSSELFKDPLQRGHDHRLSRVLEPWRDLEAEFEAGPDLGLRAAPSPPRAPDHAAELGMAPSISRSSAPANWTETNPEAETGAVNEVDGEAGDSSHSLHEASALSLEEEVVEIDAEAEPAPGPAPETAAPGPDAATPEGEAAASAEEQAAQAHGIKRKRESDDDGGEITSVKEFNQNLLRLLECPVCLEWMEPPMWQCRRGHLVCGRCRARLSACPVCRTAFSSVRNRAMEGVAEMVRYPCRHGCGRDLQLRRRGAHEASCAARRYRCPAPACDSRPPLPHSELAAHLQSKHLAMVKVGRKHKFSMKVNTEQHDNWVIMCLQQLFHLRVVVDIRTWGVVVYVAYIGPKCRADDYTYEVTVTGQHNSRKLVYTRATHCDLECSSLNVNRQDCFHLTLDQALNFLRVKNKHCEPDKYLNFNIEISRGTPSVEDVDS